MPRAISGPLDDLTGLTRVGYRLLETTLVSNVHSGSLKTFRCEFALHATEGVIEPFRIAQYSWFEFLTNTFPSRAYY